MGVYRTYFNKDNVIIRNSTVNTGRNQITELYHGGSTNINNVESSRYIFNIDLSDLLVKLSNKEIFLDRLTHKINLTNTSSFDLEKFCKTASVSCGEVNRATGFDLILFKVPETWDEGNGYDYTPEQPINCVVSDVVNCDGPSNWYDRHFYQTWSQPGIYNDPSVWYSGNTSGYTGTTIDLILSEIHFDHGNENICVDVTSYINDLLLSGITETSLGLAFEYSEEISTQDNSKYYVGFFSKDTQTVYEPFMESLSDDVIKDDRDNFHLDKSNNLCLYVNAGGERVNATFSDVTIYDHNDNTYVTIPSSGITQITTGVYCVGLNISSNPVSGYCGNIQFRDVWNNVTVDGNNLGSIDTLDFIIKDKSSYYNIGSNNSAGSFGLGSNNSNNRSIYDYEFAVHGIKRREKIKRGDTRRVDVTARIPLTMDQSQTIDKIYYRLFIKEGEVQLDYVDWHEVSRTPDGNFFFLDTSWLIPNDYFLELKIHSGNQIRTYNDTIQFEVVSEKDWC